MTLEDRGTEQPENMTEQAERLVKLKDESGTVDMCGPQWPEHGPKTRISRELESSNSIVLQRSSRVERVTGIEPALSAWEEFLSHRVSVSLQRYWRPQLAPGDPYRPGLVARVWPGSLASRAKNRALAEVAWPRITAT